MLYGKLMCHKIVFYRHLHFGQISKLIVLNLYFWVHAWVHTSYAPCVQACERNFANVFDYVYLNYKRY